MLSDDPESQARLLYLSLLGAVVALGLFYHYRNRLGAAMQHAAIWGLIFIAAVAAYGFKDHIKSALFPDAAQHVDPNTVSLRRANDGHFYARAKVNGTEVRFLVDTGATNLVLSQRDARRVGIDMDNLKFILPTYTANGRIYGAGVVLDRVEIGRFKDENVRAIVNGGGMRDSLLGMTYLELYQGFRVDGDTLYLSR